jgi:hypothetical protein
MHGTTFPGVPGLGLAPAMSTPRINHRAQDALRRDAWDREEATFVPCPPAERREKLTRPVRAGAA